MARYGGLGSALGAGPVRRIALSVLVTQAFVAAAAVPARAASPGELYAFGWNIDGQLGNTTNAGTNTANPTPALVTLAGATGPVVEAAGGTDFSLAVTSTGQVFAFGANDVGQLGRDANTGNDNPNPPGEVRLGGASGSAVAAFAGDEHSLVVTSRGLLYAFGWNRDGELGVANNVGTDNPNATPTLVTLPDASGGVVRASAGTSHSLAVTSAGQLYAFGDNTYGQLGNGKASTSTPRPVGLPAATGPVVDVAAGESHSLAVTSTGQLYAFGDNQFGQLGNPVNLGTSTANPTPALVTLPGATGGVVQVGAGEYHSLALTSTGQVFAFGRNEAGQLGSPVGNRTSTPTLVAFPGATGPVIQIGAGGIHSLALTSTGQLYGFGNNLEGELTGSALSVTTPTLITIAGGATIDTVGGGPEAFHTLAVIANLSVATMALPRGAVGEAYGAGLQAGGGTGPFKWIATGLPGGLSIDATGGTITGTPTASGTYTVTATVTDRDGLTASKQLSLAVDPAASPRPTPTAALSALSVAPHTFIVGGRLVNGRCVPRTRANRARLHCARPLALRIAYRLSAPASVTFTIKRSSTGRLAASGRCVARTRTNARQRRCIRLLPIAGVLVRSGAAGGNSFGFNGRIGGRGLATGSYQLTGAPAGGGAAQTSPFALLR